MHKCSCTRRPRSCTGACDLPQMGCTAALYNIDYYVVSPLTLMGCYSDLKWFNGSQVGPLMALFILQCLLWMWMTVLWSASVFSHICSNSVTGAALPAEWRDQGKRGGRHVLTSQSLVWLAFSLTVHPSCLPDTKRLWSYGSWRFIVWWKRQDINSLELPSSGLFPLTFSIYSLEILHGHKKCAKVVPLVVQPLGLPLKGEY